MSHKNVPWLKWVSELQSISQNGLTYCADPFCQQRYQMLKSIAAEIAAQHTDSEHAHVVDLFNAQYGYATPKLDIRGVIFKDNKILLVKENSDGLWSLPGGWADVNESPADCVVREIWEESGYETRAVKLLALYDKHKHDHPPQFPHAYKCFFLCEILGGEPKPSLETSAIQFFAENELPELSVHRVMASQIKRLFEHKDHPEWPTDFD
ncbi:NUDIX hydrolase [Candidiatus Paracoxiella cheracis]|uniref:NUDIX hydrolase n=1 Tax=Candidiatus Paracoxiella cheracis TaxID=3405120 RepID=UPI003BF50616